MLALKKKREAEAKAKAEADGSGSAVQSPGTAPSSSSNKVSLLGAVGGKKKKSDGTGSGGTKKRTPGEIRIQKGEEDTSRQRFLVALMRFNGRVQSTRHFYNVRCYPRPRTLTIDR